MTEVDDTENDNHHDGQKIVDLIVSGILYEDENAYDIQKSDNQTSCHNVFEIFKSLVKPING